MKTPDAYADVRKQNRQAEEEIEHRRGAEADIQLSGCDAPEQNEKLETPELPTPRPASEFRISLESEDEPTETTRWLHGAWCP
jgi:hypothetical protein